MTFYIARIEILIKHCVSFRLCIVAVLRFYNEKSRRNMLRSFSNEQASITIFLNQSLYYLFQYRS